MTDYNIYNQFKSTATNSVNLIKVWNPLIPCIRQPQLTPNQLKYAVLRSPRLTELIAKDSKGDRAKAKKLTAEIKTILDEIGLDRSMPTIRWVGVLVKTVVRNKTDGIFIHEESLRNVKNRMGNTPVLYLPCHRSYADFILMSFICFAYDLEIPGIASGMDFYKMKIIGTVLRKTGAFYMRRSFSNDFLYWEVFNEYVMALISQYHIGIEFFLEGTRSRSFKALPPKIGLLSMALKPLFFSEVEDILIVPVGFAYNKPLEEPLFPYELLGVPKPKESTKRLFKALKALNVNYGKIFVKFGEPISAKQYFGKHILGSRQVHSQYPSHVQQLTKDDMSLISDLALHVVDEQQHLIVITIFNLISVIYCYSEYVDNKLRLSELHDYIFKLAQLIISMGGNTEVCGNDLNIRILEAVENHNNLIKWGSQGSLELIIPNVDFSKIDYSQLKGHRLNEVTLKNCVPALTMQIYVNPVMYWLAPLGIIVLSYHLKSTNDNERIPIDDVREEFARIRKLFVNEFVCNKQLIDLNFEASLRAVCERNVLNCNDSFIIKGDDTELGNVLLSAIAPFLCSYLQITTILINKFVNKVFNESELCATVQAHVEQGLINRKEFIHPYCLSIDTIGIGLSSLAVNGIVSKSRKDLKVFYEINESLVRQIQSYILSCMKHLKFNYLRNYSLNAKL